VVLEKRELPGFTSASGLQRVKDTYFIVGDGSTELSRLDLNFKLLGNTHLYDPVPTDAQPGAKKLKRDLEVVMKLEHNGRVELLCFGSGSKSPLRDVIYRLDVTDPSNPGKVSEVSTVSLYNAFRDVPDIVGTEKLNVEGACVFGDKLLIFQRGNRAGINPIIELGLDSFIAYVNDSSKPPPSFKVHKVQLPFLWENPAGFSDAVIWNGMILFSASVEVKNPGGAGTNATFFGLVRLGAEKPEWCVPVTDDKGEVLRIKVEGLSIVSEKDGSFVIDSVTDPDGGASELVKLALKKQ